MTREGTEVDDYFDILLKYEKTRVHVHGGYFFKDQLPGFILYGTKGSFLKSRADVQEDQLQAGMTPDSKEYGIESVDEKGVLHIDTRKGQIPTERGNYMDFYEGVYQSIRKGASEPVTASDGVLVMQVIDAAFESYEKGVVIKL